MASGRKSDAPASQAEAAGMRPAPPEYFDEDCADIWRKTVAACAPGWFPPQTLPLLAMFCTHVRDWHRYAEHAERVYAQAADEQGLDTGMHGYWLSARERERKAVFDMATKMRLTQQSIYHPEKGKNKSRHGKLPHEA